MLEEKTEELQVHTRQSLVNMELATETLKYSQFFDAGLQTVVSCIAQLLSHLFVLVNGRLLHVLITAYALTHPDLHSCTHMLFPSLPYTHSLPFLTSPLLSSPPCLHPSLLSLPTSLRLTTHRSLRARSLDYRPSCPPSMKKLPRRERLTRRTSPSLMNCRRSC